MYQCGRTVAFIVINDWIIWWIYLIGIILSKLRLQSWLGQESNPSIKSTISFLILFQFDKEKIEEMNFGESKRFILLANCNASRITSKLAVMDGKDTVLEDEISIDLLVGISILIITIILLICYKLLGKWSDKQ